MDTVPVKWEPEDVARWCDLIRRNELDFAEQVRIVQFISDQQQHYSTLFEQYKQLWDVMQGTRERIRLLSGPVDQIMQLAENGDMYDDATFRVALKFWTDQIVEDLL